jgi:histone-lysine N-methyltransferase SETD3
MNGSRKVTRYFLISDDPERKRFDKLLKWLLDGGSKFEKLKIRYYSRDYRGVHAARNVKKGDILLFVPLSQIITLEMAFESPIGRKMVQKNMKNRLLSPKHSFLSTYLMQERRKDVTQFDEYLDILPKDLSCFPIFFKPEEKAWLKGSPFLTQVEEKIEDIRQDYDLLCKEVPEYE